MKRGLTTHFDAATDATNHTTNCPMFSRAEPMGFEVTSVITDTTTANTATKGPAIEPKKSWALSARFLRVQTIDKLQRQQLSGYAVISCGERMGGIGSDGMPRKGDIERL